tara:strand:- start:652 stop:867 length:216 start_codon:yes stop_codon:yes gene_type:complete
MISSGEEKVESVWICGVSENFPPEFFADDCDSDTDFAVSSSKSLDSSEDEENCKYKVNDSAADIEKDSESK